MTWLKSVIYKQHIPTARVVDNHIIFMIIEILMTTPTGAQQVWPSLWNIKVYFSNIYIIYITDTSLYMFVIKQNPDQGKAGCCNLDCRCKVLCSLVPHTVVPCSPWSDPESPFHMWDYRCPNPSSQTTPHQLRTENKQTTYQLQITQ